MEKKMEEDVNEEDVNEEFAKKERKGTETDVETMIKAPKAENSYSKTNMKMIQTNR